jgi:signal transduction histidine kinase/CheY-like chemotaxis protein
MERRLHEAALDSAADVAAARRHARLLATRLGLEPWARTRFAVAVTEVAQIALGGGHLSFRVERQADGPALLLAEITGPGLLGLDDGSMGLRRLVDLCQVEKTTVRLGRSLHDATLPVDALLALPQPMDEADIAENKELLAAIAEIDRLNAELEDTNRGVVALYAELDERAEQLRQASELKSRFLSNMSHEFRTPLNSILALARLLLDRVDGALTEEQDRQVGYIRRSAESLAELVNDLLDLAKVEAGKLDLRPAPFTVAELFGGLRGVMKPLQQSDAVDLVFDDAAECPALFTDEAKVAQVLRNLVSNALKFTEKGEVRVSAAYDRSAGRCLFTVRDTGIGIAPENHEVVFQEFSQVPNQLQGRAKGTGLGLPLSRRLAELLGGTLTVRSAPGVGSVFTLAIPPVLPLAAPDPAPPEPAAEPPSDPGGVLVIDDEEASRYVLCQMLGGVPALRIMEAENGALGLRRALAERPDVILLDLRMPGMDGFEVLDRLTANPDTRAIPVVICTSSVLDGSDHARLALAHAILSKAGLTRELMAAAIAPLVRERGVSA